VKLKKTRPVVVVSNNINNKYNKTVSILPITSNTDKVYPFEVYVGKGIGNLPKDSKIKADQIRTIDKSRLIKLVGNLPKDYLTQIDIALKIHLEID
jgi:mRNA interferase MazF